MPYLNASHSLCCASEVYMGSGWTPDVCAACLKPCDVGPGWPEVEPDDLSGPELLGLIL